MYKSLSKYQKRKKNRTNFFIETTYTSGKKGLIIIIKKHRPQTYIDQDIWRQVNHCLARRVLAVTWPGAMTSPSGSPSTRKNNKELRVTFKEKPWPNSHLGHARDISDTKAYDNDEKQWDLMGLNEKIIMDFKDSWWPMEHSQWQQMDTQRNY